MNTKRLCPECGTELASDDARGLCPRCLLKSGLGTQPEPGTTVVVEDAPSARRSLPEPGKPFGRYQIVRALGHGGMGVVYEAEEQDAGRRVALKVLGQQLDSPEHRARFLREGRLAASINHPNSVYVYGTDEIDGTPTIAMELVAGGTLQERVQKGGPMSVSAAVDAILQIIAGLEAAQVIGILHRDIKPGNCFEDTDGTIKIGDFGLSISTTARSETNVTAAGAMIGTPAYCSPEQLRGEELNARSDMYSVGVTLFYLLTGRVPFEGHNIAQLIANVLEKRAPSPRELRKEIPQGVANAVLRCLEKQPGERFKSYDELRQALAPYTSAAPTPATLGLRFLAGALDLILLGLAGTVVALARFGDPMELMNLAAQRSREGLAWMLAGLCCGTLYYAITEGFWGATLGKAICRLRVVGPNNSPPGLLRGVVRALFYGVLPVLPFWIGSRGDPYAYLRGSVAVQYLMQFSFYFVLAALFATVRRRNGFAAIHDLVTNTRVISRTALPTRPVLSLLESPPSAVEATPQVGPYQVLETLGKGDGAEWLLGYDLRLLRKVWICVVPPGTPPGPASWRTIGRVGRLRWLAGRRTREENWDAFEGATGKPLLHLIAPPLAQPQPWDQVRFWLHDLASEIGAAEKDGSLPAVLELDRVWITGDGRGKLLDFPAPGLASGIRSKSSTIQRGNAALPPLPPNRRAPHFLGELAVAALAGAPREASESADAVTVRMPLHARDFLNQLPQLPDAAAVISALKPLLHRVAVVSRLRRAAVVAGCMAFPLFACLSMMFGMTLVQKWNRQYPGLMELSTLLHQRSASHRFGRQGRGPSDPQFAVFIATHYRSVVTNDAVWSGPFALSMIKGDARRFAEQSVAERTTATDQEIAEADAALKPYAKQAAFPSFFNQPGILLFLAAGVAVIYVVVPALLAALLFRGGLILRIANVAFVRRDGAKASRVRVFWRALVAWSPVALAIFLYAIFTRTHPVLGAWLVYAVVCGLAIVSVALPSRGLPDRLAGTWPVPR
jgi:hypothetical protein